MTPNAILDCDTGHDDAMAILLAARSLNLRGITPVHGNSTVENTTRNTFKILELAGLTDIPVAAGAQAPLVRELSHAPGVHGETGLDGPDLPEPTMVARPEDAAEFIRAVSQDVDDLYLIATAPLTNLATALQRYPGELEGRIAGISLMGGSTTFGNTTPAAEFNIWGDPDAAHAVFESGIPIKMVGLNVTRQVAATRIRRLSIRAIGSRTAIAVAELLDFFSTMLEQRYGLPGASMHDPLAVTALVRPDVLHFEPMRVDIELQGTHTYGMTVCDRRHLSPTDNNARPLRAPLTEANAQVAVDVDASRFWDHFLEVLATYP